MDRQDTNSKITGCSTVADAQMNRQDFNVNLQQGKSVRPMPMKRVCLYFTIWQATLLSVCVVGLFFGAYRVYGPVKHSHQDCDPRNSKVRLSIHCLAPEAPKNSKLIEETNRNFTMGEETSFQCVYGYHLFGDEKLTCVAGGQWVKKGFCINKANISEKCSTPVTPLNATFFDVLRSYYTLGDIIDYQCDTGYQITGDGILVCTKGNQWRQVGRCRPNENELERCKTPLERNNTYFSKLPNDSYNLGDEIDYHCMVGYQLIGDGKMVCARNGKWRQTGYCRLLINHTAQCDAPVAPDNAELSGLSEVLQTNYSLGDEIKYQCDTGYHPTGDGSMVCTKGNQWRQFGHCRLNENHTKRCKAPSEKNNTRLFQDSNDTYSLGDEIDYQCVVGYQLVGDGKMVCARNGSWWQAGYCRLQKIRNEICGEPIEPDNANFNGVLQTNYTPGDEIDYQCDTGYQLMGDGKMVCVKGSLWRQVGHCVPSGIQCNPPNDTVNGNFQPVKAMYNVNDSVSYSCDSGYGIEGYYFLTCLQNGAWNYPTPKCTELETPQCINGSWTTYFYPLLNAREGTFANINEYCRSYPDMCPQKLPSAVDVVYEENRRLHHYRLKKQIVHLDPQRGLTCLNSEQIDGRLCYRIYAVRFCLPVPADAPSCSQQWTRFLNQDRPSGTGDYEGIVLISGQTICQNYPTSIDARLVHSNEDVRASGRKLRQTGAQVSCVNADNNGSCPDMKVRYCCKEVTCPSGKWTHFFNLDSPDGEGDYEMIVDARRRHPTQMCSGNVTAIDARNVNDGGWGYSQHARPVHIDTNVGFWCLNSEQPLEFKDCRDYRVRFCCE